MWLAQFSLDRGPAKKMTNGVGKEPPIRKRQFFCQQDNAFYKTCHVFTPFLFVKVVVWQQHFAWGEGFINCFFTVSIAALFWVPVLWDIFPVQGACSSVCLRSVALPFVIIGERVMTLLVSVGSSGVETIVVVGGTLWAKDLWLAMPSGSLEMLLYVSSEKEEKHIPEHFFV